MAEFGLIGKQIAYTFSESYFSEKFKKEALPFSYKTFDLNTIEAFSTLIQKHSFKGLNVTIPYKEAIIPFLDSLDYTAQAIGAVNTLKFKGSQIIGYNTDYIGFTNSLKPYLPALPKRTALVLGTGGAAKAIVYALTQLNFKITLVSRTATQHVLSYSALTALELAKHFLVVNCTPLGTSPNSSQYPNIPFEGFTKVHLAYDLIYNPAETTFLKRAKMQGAQTCNGYNMLIGQAEAAWKIWNQS